MQPVIRPDLASIGERPPKGKILIIENNGSLRKALADLLNEHYLIQECASIEEGKSDIQRFHPDLILLQKELLDISGADALNRLKSTSSSAIAILLLSGQTTIEEAVAAVKAGAADLISTPVEPSRLLRIIEQNLKHVRRRKDLTHLPEYPDIEREGGAWLFSGNLENVFIADLLQFPAFSQLTGSLEIQSGFVNTSIFFLNGEILSAGSSDPAMYLGQFLLRKGIVGENKLLELIRRQDEEQVFLGKLLIQEGLASESTVSEILIEKITETVTNLFLQRKGIYNFYQNLVPPYLFHIVNVPVLGLIMQGELKAEMWHKIRKVVPNSEMIVESLVPPEELPPGSAIASSETLRRMLAGNQTVEEILYETHSTEWELLSYLYPLYEEGTIRFVPNTSASDAPHEKIIEEQSLDRVRRWLIGGEYEKALSLLYRLIKYSDCDLNVASPLLDDAETKFRTWFYSHVMRAQDVPLRLQQTTTRAGRQPMQVFLLNRINGVRNVRSLVSLCPAREVEVLIGLQHLLESGEIETQKPGASGEYSRATVPEAARADVGQMVEQILGDLPIGVITLDESGIVQFTNKYFQKIAVVSADAVQGKPIATIFPDIPIGAIQDSHEREFVWTGLEKTSAVKRYWLYSIHSFQESQQVSKGATVLVRDVTESHRRDVDEFRKDRLTSIGEFVAGMIHQLKNPVMLLETAVKLLAAEKLSPQQIQDIGQRMQKNVDRVRNLISDTLNYVSMDESTFNWMNLNDLIRETLHIFRDQNSNVEFRFDPLLSAPMIRGNVVQIREVVVNLISNAMQAMENHGKIQIVTDLQEELEGGISRKYLLMVISDTGPGISPAAMEKLFTPFFTTKASGKGLGLAFAKRILEEQGGFMRCWSKVGIGTHFYVYFKIGDKDAFYLDRG